MILYPGMMDAIKQQLYREEKEKNREEVCVYTKEWKEIKE